MVSIKKRIERLEKAMSIRRHPPLVVFSHNSNEVTGIRLREGGAPVMRIKGESVRDLEDRALKAFGLIRGEGSFYAITRSWGPWPYMPEVTEGEWAAEAKRHYEEMGGSDEFH